MGFLAVLSALAAPVSMLAEDVRTGKLGGLCSLNTTDSTEKGVAGGSNKARQTSTHCELCGTPAIALLVSVNTPTGTFALLHLATFHLPETLANVVVGLPFGRGPPTHV